MSLIELKVPDIGGHENVDIIAVEIKAGDTIVAINGYACIDFIAQTETQIGDRHTVHYFRHGVLHQTTLTVQAAAANTAYLKIVDNARLQVWLTSGQDAAKAA